MLICDLSRTIVRSEYSGHRPQKHQYNGKKLFHFGFERLLLKPPFQFIYFNSRLLVESFVLEGLDIRILDFSIAAQILLL